MFYERRQTPALNPYACKAFSHLKCLIISLVLIACLLFTQISAKILNVDMTKEHVSESRLKELFYFSHFLARAVTSLIPDPVKLVVSNWSLSFPVMYNNLEMKLAHLTAL